jgi:Protein of unknown function (DUF3326)
MRLFEHEWELPWPRDPRDLLGHFARIVRERLGEGEYPVRFVVCSTDAARQSCHCEVGVLAVTAETPAGRSPGPGEPRAMAVPSIFEFLKRPFECTEAFNVVFLVPTGINATIGGHAGDAGPVARLLASVCDTLILHPNVVNASDINEMPENALYVEGSVIARLLMGTVGLRRVRSNRVLVVIDRHEEIAYSHAAINAVNAARACYGFDCPRIVMLDPPVKLVSQYTSTGRAAGRVDNLGVFLDGVGPYLSEADAIAVSSVIAVPPEFHQDYFDSGGGMVNPWGGVEAIFTHALSILQGLPTAHSPMIESEEIESIDPGIVDPRMAAEAVSLTFLQSILKGLRRSPRIVTDPAEMQSPSCLTARDISCLVIPDGCLGLPVLAALEQGIPVIGVRDSSHLMNNDLAALPWAPGQFTSVDNYFEAVGVLCARKSGLAPDSVRRPIQPAPVVEVVRRRRAARRGSACGPPGRGPGRNGPPVSGLC